MPGRSTIPTAKVFGGVFWLNLLVVLLATSWIPLVSLEHTDAAGAVQRQSVPVYFCYRALLSEPSAVAIAAVLVHLTVCFVISFTMRRLLLRAQAER